MAERVDIDNLEQRLADYENVQAFAIEHFQIRKLLRELRAHREREAGGGWIACSERMPAERDPVWFVIHAGLGVVHKGRMGADDFVNEARFCWRKHEVAWWRPRYVEEAPPPPKETP